MNQALAALTDRLPPNPPRKNRASSCHPAPADQQGEAPEHIMVCECDEHDGFCKTCGFKITVGPSSIEYGHGRSRDRGSDADGVRHDCPHRPASCDPGTFTSSKQRGRSEDDQLVPDGGQIVSDAPDQEGDLNDTRVGHTKADETAVYVGRGPDGCSMEDTEIGNRGWLGNPYALDDGYSRAESIKRFRQDFERRLQHDMEFREAVRDLSGQTLGCWCQRLDDDSPACHAEVIAEHADRLATEQERFDEAFEDVVIAKPLPPEHERDDTTCHNCGEPWDDGDDWDVRHISAPDSLGETWKYECPGCEEETFEVGT